jgi:hypothetical protein
MAKQKAPTFNKYDSNGNLKRMTKLSPFLIRPLYQYTSQEIRNHQRESWGWDEWVEANANLN